MKEKLSSIIARLRELGYNQLRNEGSKELLDIAHELTMLQLELDDKLNAIIDALDA